MEIVKLIPSTKDYIWGGEKLKKQWGKLAPYDHIAETWELSFNKDAPSFIASGKDQDRPLFEVVSKEELGTALARFEDFPVLIKFIDSSSNLSVQVHPDDAYALKNENQYGKTEMWYVLDAEEGSGLYVGFKKDTNEKEVRKAIEDGSIMELLNFIPVKKGQSFFIPSGTVHAIGAGVTVIEIQQNSTLTYRLYDYHRLGKDGKPRELHVDKAMKVIDFSAYHPLHFPSPLIGECSYFSSSVYSFAGEKEIEARPSSFVAISFLEGEGTFEGIAFKKGDTFFVPAGKKGRLVGKGEYVITQVK